MRTVLTVSCDVAAHERQAAIDALHDAGITTMTGPQQPETLVVATTSHDGSQPTLTTWDLLDQQVRDALANRCVSLRATNFGIHSVQAPTAPGHPHQRGRC